MKNFRIFISLLLVAASIFMGVAFFPTPTRAVANITISNAKYISNKHVLVTFNNPGSNLATVTASKWHINVNGDGTSPLTATGAAITSAGTPWTVTLTFDPHPAWNTDQVSKASVGLYVDANGVTSLLGDSNVVLTDVDAVAIADAQKPVVSSAQITAANTATITYSEQVSTVLGNYTTTEVSGVPRSITSINTDANPSILLTFNGAAAAVNATGVVKIENVTDAADVPNTIDSISSQAITDGQAPTLTSVDEFDVNHDGAIDETLLGFDEAIADSSVTPAYFIINSVPANTVMAANSTNGVDTNTANDTKITVKVAAGVAGTEAKDVVHLINSVTDSAGNSIANGTFFAASANDNAAPVVMSKSPASGATDVAASSDVAMTFSEPMNTASPAFTFNFAPAPSYTSAWSNSNKTLTLSSMGLSSVAGSTYTLNTTAASASGGAVTALYGLPYSWSFTVVANSASSGGGVSRGSGSGGATFIPSFASPPSASATVTPTFTTGSSTAATPETPATASPAAPGVPTFPPTIVPGAPAVAIPAELFRSFTRYLFYGTRGTEVSLLQTLLKQLGFFHFPRVTGYFGPYTRAAVRRFQAAHGIEQVGVVGPKTRAALNALPK